VAERSPGAKRSGSLFSRGRLTVGLVLVTAMAAALAYAFGANQGGPDPGRLVYAGNEGVFVRELETGKVRRVGPLPDDTSLGIASPDGRWYSYVERSGALWMLSLEENRRFELSGAAAVPLGWSPDNKLVARELLDDRDIVLIDPEGGTRVLWSRGAGGVRFPVWLDDSRFVMFDERSQKELALVKLAGSRSTVTHIGTGNPVAASPDGKEILLQRGETLVVAKVDDERLTDERKLFDGTIGHASVSDQGYVAFTAKDEEGREGVWVLQGGNESEKVLSERVAWMDWSRDGSTILYAKDGSVYALILPDGKPKKVSEEVTVFDINGFAVVP
jgi:hypothetical protein